jgi:hypothetical protein
MTESITKYWQQESQSTELARTQRDTAHLAAVTRAAYDIVGTIYIDQVRRVVPDLENMNSKIRTAMKGGMPPGQAEAVYKETVRYQEYQSAIADHAASTVLEALRKRF